MVKGCEIEGQWQHLLPGETYYPSSHPNSHYWRAHYVHTEADYHRRLDEQRAERKEHYRRTGQILPPRL